MNDQCGCVREPGCRLTGKNDWWTAESDWRPWVITLVESSVITHGEEWFAHSKALAFCFGRVVLSRIDPSPTHGSN